MATCKFCAKPAVGICCSSHNDYLCHQCYRGTHFVEVCVKATLLMAFFVAIFGKAGIKKEQS